MKIGIDVRVLGNPVKSGVEEYTENLLSHMLPLNKDVEYKLFYSSYKTELPDFDWLRADNVKIFKYKIPNKLLFASAGLFNLPKIDLLMGGVDVFFSPHFFLTSLSGNCKRVTTFHDLSYIRFPEFFSGRKNIWHNFEMRPSWQSRFSDKLIAVSDSTKRDLVKFYNIDPVKIDVIHSGIGEIKRPAEDELNNFKNKNGLPKKFILFLGKLEPRKNIVGIIDAFEILKNNNKFNDLSLMIIGAKGWLYKDIFHRIQNSKFKEQIIYKEHVGDDERRFYYSSAEMLIYPSYFEGFGFPPLEAMACGTPVISSSNSSIPEVAGNAAILVEPANIDDMVTAIESIYSEYDLKNTLVHRGLKRAGGFNWESTAKKTLECLTGVAK